MIDLNDFTIKETIRKKTRYKGEVNRNKYYRCNCPNCGIDLGYITKSRYSKKTSCNKCSLIKKENFAKNHWSKLNHNPWNKGMKSDGQDLRNRLRTNLRSRLYQAIKGNYKAGSAVGDLGCSIEELKKHLESQFLPGMSWDNWSRAGWHIDHKKALANFDLTNREELLKACCYTNLQPLWAVENISWGAKNKDIDGRIDSEDVGGISSQF